jgi:hypothetical protein
VLPFSFDAEVVKFAKAFLRETPGAFSQVGQKYIRCLEADPAARDNFKKCMAVCFPR